MIRAFKISDREALCSILNLNIPTFFDPSELNDFKHYIDFNKEDYFIFEEDQKILGGGGINYFPDRMAARISWDFIHPDYHGKGIGKQLLQHRIDFIKQQNKFTTIEVRTSQFATEFYAKTGFKLIKVTENYWAEGFDLYLMQLPLRNQ